MTQPLCPVRRQVTTVGPIDLADSHVVVDQHRVIDFHPINERQGNPASAVLSSRVQPKLEQHGHDLHAASGTGLMEQGGLGTVLALRHDAVRVEPGREQQVLGESEVPGFHGPRQQRPLVLVAGGPPPAVHDHPQDPLLPRVKGREDSRPLLPAAEPPPALSY